MTRKNPYKVENTERKKMFVTIMCKFIRKDNAEVSKFLQVSNPSKHR